MLLNSLTMAMMIAVGKISISLLSAFAIVYFKFPFRMGFFLVNIHNTDAASRSTDTSNI
jgi:ABC-type glycerol-3-phosphate transport system permease component